MTILKNMKPSRYSVNPLVKRTFICAHQCVRRTAGLPRFPEAVCRPMQMLDEFVPQNVWFCRRRISSDHSDLLVP